MNLPSHDILRFWRFANVAAVRSDQPDLTLRQMSVMLIVYLTEGPHTVRGLAGKLNVGKPVITRAIDALSRKRLIKRVRDQKDKRNVLIQHTMGGMAFLHEFETIVSSARDAAAAEVEKLA